MKKQTLEGFLGFLEASRIDEAASIYDSISYDEEANFWRELCAYRDWLKTQRLAPEWQPIETAPKTSQAIVVWCPDRQNTYVACWSFADEYWVHFAPCGVRLRETPTHWMPLPEPPEAVKHPGIIFLPLQAQIIRPESYHTALGLAKWLKKQRTAHISIQTPLATWRLGNN